MSLQDWLWIPNQSIGVVHFETSIQIYIDSIGAFMTESADEITNWEIYELNNEDIVIFVENGLVAAVTTYEYLYFKDINLIGIHQEELIEVLETEPDEIGTSVLYEDGDVQTPLEFESLGLEAWMRDDYVVSGSCNNMIPNPHY